MRRFIYLLFILILVVTLVEVWYYFFMMGAKSPSEEPSQLMNREVTFPSPTSYIVSDILYQKPNDPEGRSVIYQNQAYPYPGIGEVYKGGTSSAKLSQLQSIIGTFWGWEKISGSKDQYILLQNPLEKKSLRKVRVAYENLPLSADKCRNATGLYVENFSTGMVEDTNKLVLSLSDKELNSLLKDGDAVAVDPRLNPKDWLVIDKDTIVCASKLIVRRKDGLPQIK